jgi:hypothetical protein
LPASSPNRRASVDEPGLPSGAVDEDAHEPGQKFVIGGYTRGTKTFDTLVFGYYDRNQMIYAAEDTQRLPP